MAKPISCPFCDYEAVNEYDILYHMEDLHPEGESPFIAKGDQEDEDPSSRFQAVEDNGYVECPIFRCGEAIPVTELDSHLELHSTEEKEADSPLESTTSHDELDGLKPSSPIFDTKLPVALRNLHGSSHYLSPSAERQAKAKDSWRDILNMPLSSLSQTPPKKGSNGRLGTSELGPHANEDKMPAWLHKLLLTDGKPEIVNKLLPGGGMTTTQVIKNYAAGIIPVIEQLLKQDPATAYAYICQSSVEHVSKLKNEGGFCGYRNIQMMISYIINEQSQGYYHFEGKIPSIFQIQDFIEHAWDIGINAVGRRETGGIRGTRKYIGTPEAQAMCYSLDIACSAKAFKSDGTTKADETLLRDVEQYFSAGCVDSTLKVRSTPLPPIYFQHPGHSMTIIGFEKKKDGSQNLLVFDPMFHDAPGILRLVGTSFSCKNYVELLRAYQRGTKYLKKYRAFEILRLCPPRVPPVPS